VGSGLLGSGLILPRAVRADDDAAARRRFLLIHCYGGWDTTYCFQPNFGASGVDMEADATAGEANGIAFVDSENRPHVRSFFETYGARACVINGVEVNSITHERCSRIMLTGAADSGGDDWGATLAALSTSELLLPYLVISGTAFASQYADRIVRVGSDGQLSKLLAGGAMGPDDIPAGVPSGATASRVDEWLSNRAAALAETSPMAQSFASAHADALALQAWRDTLSLGGVPSGCEHFLSDVSIALDAFETGLARTALVQYRGWCSQGWDTHGNNSLQGMNFEELFEYLARLLADLDTRTSATGGALADEVTIVVLSEMGRTPALNAEGGRDHWTFTSTLLLGAGVRGGQVVGGYDENGYGLGTDYATGETTDAGAVIQAANVGATLLALGDVDPGAIAPLTAVIA
jgi:hypothetical protein